MRTIILLWLFSVLVNPAVSQNTTKPTLRDQVVHLPNLEHQAGAMPMAYATASQSRARAYQRSLESGLGWMEQQLGLHLPMELYVLDQSQYGSVKDAVPWPLPYSDDTSKPNIIVFPARAEDLGITMPREKLPMEYVLFHEAGHNYAAALHIRSGNAWVNELIANMFMAEYATAKRPDFLWTLGGAAAYGITKLPHYTSLRDLDYVYAQGVGPENYAWYQLEITRLSGYLIEGQTLAEVTKKLRAEFPADESKQETLEQITSHLDHIRPGSKVYLDHLYGPSILARISTSRCSSSTHHASQPMSVIAVRNDRAHAVTVTSPDGTRETLAPGRWDSFIVGVGDEIRITAKDCIVAQPNSSLAILSNN